MKCIKVKYTKLDKDGWPTTVTATAWEHDDGRLYEHKLDKDGWPLEVLRTDYKKVED